MDDLGSAERLLEVLARANAVAPDGASSIDEIAGFVSTSRRTLQRQLAALVASGRVRAIGHGPARRYAIGGRPSLAVAEPTPLALAPDTLPISTIGSRLRAQIERPLTERKPVGYVARFLERYRPNTDAYLGEKLRKHLHSIGRIPGEQRPAGTYARQILSRLLVDLSWASSRLEGNTYTRLDTQNLIEFGRRAPGKDQREAQMILNHKAAIEMLVDGAEQVRFDRYTICNLHALLADNLLVDPAALGRVRPVEVAISGTVYLPLAIPQRLEQLFDRFLATASKIRDPFEQAFFAMVHLPYLQPFVDVNKRVSRLAANIPFIRHNLVPLAFVDVPDRDYVDGVLAIYELRRVELLRDVFAWAYERSSQRYAVVRESLPEPDPLRLRTRDALTEVVQGIVRDDSPIDDRVIRTLAAPLVAKADLSELVAMAVGELERLHEGNLARYRLRPSELARWRRNQTRQ
ncbi:MAG TPA: Fic family protein [Kofleriaceae bacterium]|jgi:Fic family protein